MQKLGIFAGSFDPIHNGHLAFAATALELGLERVMFLPEPRPRRKQGVRALEHRIAMVQLAVVTNTAFGVIALEQARFTVHQTLPLLQARFPGYKLVMMFGDDVTAHIADWPNIDALLTSTELLIANRKSTKITDLQSSLATIARTKGLKFNYQIIELAPTNMQIASSKIRQNIKHHQTTNDIPETVLEYINQHQLY